MTKISALPADASPTVTDYIVTVDIETGQTKKVLLSDLLTLINASGVPSAANFSNPYKFSAYKSVGANTAAGSFAKVTYETELFDTGNNFDNATNYRFVAPISGFYQFNWISHHAAATDTVSGLYKNGATLRWGVELLPGGNSGSVGSCMVQATVGDYFEIFHFANSAVAYDTGAAPVKTGFDGHLVSKT